MTADNDQPSDWYGSKRSAVVLISVALLMFLSSFFLAWVIPDPSMMFLSAVFFALASLTAYPWPSQVGIFKWQKMIGAVLMTVIGIWFMIDSFL